MAEGVATLRRLCLADEHDDVALPRRVFPDEEAAPWQASGADQPVLHLDVLDVEELMSGELCQNVHAELRHEIVARADRHMPHPGPNGDHPGLIQLDCGRHLRTPLFWMSVTTTIMSALAI